MNIIISTIFVGQVDGSIYDNNISKDKFILKPGVIAYNNGVYTESMGGVNNFTLTKNNVLVPAYTSNQGYDDKHTYDDVKPKDKVAYYIVQPGDNVLKIAKKFGISKETIIRENNLNSRGFLKLKQKLTILPVSGVSYVIKKGDTLKSIAKKFSVDSNKISAFNDLGGNLKIGEKIIIPGGEKKSLVKKITPKKKVSPKKVVTNKKNNSKVTKKVVKSKTSSKKSSIYSYFVRPSAGRATSPYGIRWGRMHWGVDFAQGRGANIVAAASGTVTKVYKGCRVGNSKCGGGFGNYIEITHSNGYKTRYAHLIKTYVSKGQKVVKGQLIAGMGNTGHVSPMPRSYKSTAGTHLHFEIVNPQGRRISPNFLR